MGWVLGLMLGLHGNGAEVRGPRVVFCWHLLGLLVGLVLEALDPVGWWVSSVVLRFSELAAGVGADAACVWDWRSCSFLEVLDVLHCTVVLAVACDASV